jgi:hypothetical protein
MRYAPVGGCDFFDCRTRKWVPRTGVLGYSQPPLRGSKVMPTWTLLKERNIKSHKLSG